MLGRLEVKGVDILPLFLWMDWRTPTILQVHFSGDFRRRRNGPCIIHEHTIKRGKNTPDLSERPETGRGTCVVPESETPTIPLNGPPMGLRVLPRSTLGVGEVSIRGLEGKWTGGH